jgi:hypothetical protein
VNITAPLGVSRVSREATVQNARMDIISQMGNVLTVLSIVFIVCAMQTVVLVFPDAN